MTSYLSASSQPEVLRREKSKILKQKAVEVLLLEFKRPAFVSLCLSMQNGFVPGRAMDKRSTYSTKYPLWFQWPDLWRTRRYSTDFIIIFWLWIQGLHLIMKKMMVFLVQRGCGFANWQMMLPISGKFCLSSLDPGMWWLMIDRMNQTMTRMQKMKEDEYSSFLRVLFGLTTPSLVADPDENIEWIDPSLNDSQKDAIKFALGSRETALIHGPPGVSSFSQRFSFVDI